MNIKVKDIIFLALVVGLGNLFSEFLNHVGMNLIYQFGSELGIFKKEQV